MAKKIWNLDRSPQAAFGTAAYGNVSVLRFDFKTDASGKINDTELKTDDVVYLGELPEGFRLDDAQAFVTSADAEGKVAVGYAYKDGSGGDAGYFFAEQDLASPVRARAAQAKWVTLAKDAYLTLTVKADIGAKEAALGVLVSGEMLGNK